MFFFIRCHSQNTKVSHILNHRVQLANSSVLFITKDYCLSQEFFLYCSNQIAKKERNETNSCHNQAARLLSEIQNGGVHAGSFGATEHNFRRFHDTF